MNIVLLNDCVLLVEFFDSIEFVRAIPCCRTQVLFWISEDSLPMNLGSNPHGFIFGHASY